MKNKKLFIILGIIIALAVLTLLIFSNLEKTLSYQKSGVRSLEINNNIGKIYDAKCFGFEINKPLAKRRDDAEKYCLGIVYSPSETCFTYDTTSTTGNYPEIQVDC